MSKKKIELAFKQAELDYLDAIEALQKECGVSSREAEAVVEEWQDGEPLTADLE